MEHQPARIKQLDTELDAVTSHSLAQGRKLRRQEQQIDRVREARSMINRIIANAERGVDLGDPVTLAKSIVNKLNDALGDTDD